MATFELVIDGQTYSVEVGDVSRSPVTVVVNGVTKMVGFAEAGAAAPVAIGQPQAAVQAAPTEPAAQAAPVVQVAPAGSVAGEIIVAPMPGKILSVLVTVGSTIKKGDAVCTLEAMKMEMPISATAAGTVKAIHVRVGESVANDAPLVTIG
ncbi:MAG: biotin/lipoyl-containing protein [Anaerolineae bacterium]